MLLVMIFVLSSFLDNIAAALIGGTIAGAVFRGKVHIGYLAAIVAASNAGGSGSVVGDTTTTMMWIDGVIPLQVFEAYIAAGVALLIFGIPAAMQQQRYSPIMRDAHGDVAVDWARVVHRRADPGRARSSPTSWSTCSFNDIAERFPVHRRRRLGRAARLRARCGGPTGSELPETRSRAAIFLLSLVLAASMMPVDKLPRRVVASRAGPGLRLRGVRQHSADRAGAQAGRLRLGLSRVRRRLRRLDDLVRLVGRRRAVEPVSRRRDRRSRGCAAAGTSRSPTSSASS